jgi:hypothetical protein
MNHDEITDLLWQRAFAEDMDRVLTGKLNDQLRPRFKCKNGASAFVLRPRIT